MYIYIYVCMYVYINIYIYIYIYICVCVCVCVCVYTYIYIYLYTYKYIYIYTYIYIHTYALHLDVCVCVCVCVCVRSCPRPTTHSTCQHRSLSVAQRSALSPATRGSTTRTNETRGPYDGHRPWAEKSLWPFFPCQPPPPHPAWLPCRGAEEEREPGSLARATAGALCCAPAAANTTD